MAVPKSKMALTLSDLALTLFWDFSGTGSTEGQVTFAPKVTLPFDQGSGYLCLEGQATFCPKVR